MNKLHNELLQKESLVENLNQTSGFKRFPFDNLSITILSDGTLLRTPIHPDFAPETNLETLQDILIKNNRPVEFIHLAINTLLIEKDNRKILLDVGCGITKDKPEEGFLLKNLLFANIDPREITDIVISHFHPDHIAGLYGENNDKNYPNAKIHISEIEYDFWTQAKLADFTASGIYKINPRGIEQIIRFMQKLILDFQDQFEFIDFEKRLYDLLSFQTIPGHTPGMITTQIHSNKRTLTFIADLVHHDLIQFEHPEWSFSGDWDPRLAAANRIRLFQELASKKELVIATHLPWPGLGFINQLEGGFQWNAKNIE